MTTRLLGRPSIKAKALSRTNYPCRCMGIVMFAREAEDKDSGKHLSLNHLGMEWSWPFHQPSIRPNCGHDSSFEHPVAAVAAGPVRKWKNGFGFSKARFWRRLLHRPPGCESAQSILRPALNR